MTPRRVAALIADWRKKAVRLQAEHFPPRDACPHAYGFKECADELEAALRADPEGAARVVPPTTAGGNEVIVENGIYKSRTPFSALRAQMSPEAQARTVARTADMLKEIEAEDAARPAASAVPLDLMRQFIGWLSGDIPELHQVEVPRLAASLDRFLAGLAGADAVPSSDPDVNDLTIELARQANALAEKQR